MYAGELLETPSQFLIIVLNTLKLAEFLYDIAENSRFFDP